MVNITAINITGLSLTEATSVLQPMLFYLLGIVIYSVFIFKFYRFLGSRDFFKLNLKGYSESFIGFLEKVLSTIFYVFEFIFLLPFLSFLWFGFVAGILSMLSKTQDPSNILLVAIALVSAIRITAYYSEDLSRDLAKMLPFALLGVFLIDITYFSIDAAWATIKSFVGLWRQILYYLIFLIGLELVFRIVNLFISPFRKKEAVPVKKGKKG
ncbi:hypothetical protein ACFLZX_03690 [Nanoarchaeota archaeon]